MRIREGDDISGVAMGDWWCPCCEHDLEQIATEEDLEYARQNALDPMPSFRHWHDLPTALSELGVTAEEFSEIYANNQKIAADHRRAHGL